MAPMSPLARALAVALAALLCTAPATLAAEGGPSPNTPVPAGSGGTAAPTTVTAATSTPTVTATPPTYTVTIPSTAPGTRPLGQRPSAHPAKGSSGTSTTAIVLAAAGALLVLACGAWAVVRARGIEPHWTLALRHAMAEAAHRTSATASELGDWMRLGR